MKSSRIKFTHVAFMCFLTLSSVSGASRLICPTQPVVVTEGDALILWIHVDPLIDVCTGIVYWHRGEDEVVYSCRDGQHNHEAQTKRYRDRTTFDLDGSNWTLRIFPAQLDDNGLYTFYVPELKGRCEVEVSVVPMDQQNRTKRGGDATTTKSQGEDVTKSDHHVGENTKTVIVIVVVLVVGGVGVLIFVILWKKRREQEARMPSNNAEMGNLNP